MKIKKLCLALVAAGLLVGGNVAFAFGGDIMIYNGSAELVSVTMSASAPTSMLSSSEEEAADAAGAAPADMVNFDKEANGYIRDIAKAANVTLPDPKETSLEDNTSAYGYGKSVIGSFTMSSDDFKGLSAREQKFAANMFTSSMQDGVKTFTLKNSVGELGGHHEKKW